MAISTSSLFFLKARRMLEDFVIAGGDVNNLTTKDKIYNYIRCSKVYDENGKMIDVETKFKLLGYPRKSKLAKNLREELKNEIDIFLEEGNNFHMERKKFPFYPKLQSYSNSLKRKNIFLTHEEIMKDDLGYREYSEIYYRSKGLHNISKYRDGDGFVDSYRTNKAFNGYILELGYSLNIPYYLLITLVADEKLRECDVRLDKVAYTQRILTNHALQYGTFVGLKRDNPTVFNALDYLVRYYGDGLPERFSKSEWLAIFGLDKYDHKFRKVSQNYGSIDHLMLDLKRQYGENEIFSKDLNSETYAAIISKSAELNVNVSDVFKMYGLNYKGNTRERLSHATLTEIPYFDELTKLRDELMLKSGISIENGYCKEEVFEAKVNAVQQAYKQYQEKIENYLPKLYQATNKKETTIM